MVNGMRHTPKGYIRVGTPRAARCFRMSRSVPYQLKPFVAYPIRGRCTVAEKEGTECTLFSRRYTYRKQSRKRLQDTQQRIEEILSSSLSAMEISLHFRKKQQRGTNWSSSLGATTHVWIHCSAAKTLTIPFLGC